MAHALRIGVEGELFSRDSYGKPILPLDNRILYRFGLSIRETETALLRLFSDGLLSGTTHTCIGQEICQMSVVRSLNHPDDIVLSNHRNHGHFLTYSGDFLGLVAEIMGRQAGVCGGVGGSQHMAHRGFHSNGVQGGMTAIGAGRALAERMRNGSAVVAVFIGDGTLGQGLVYETLNLAAVWDLPMLFVVENNGIAQTTSTSLTTGGTIEGRAAAFGLRYWHIDDSHPEVFQQAEAVVDEVRTNRRPGLLVIDTARLGPHSKGDDLRDNAEMDFIRKRDPLMRLGSRLPADEREEIEIGVREFVRAICEEAGQSPAATVLPARGTIFTQSPGDAAAASIPLRDSRNVRQALNHALEAMLRTSPEVVLLGEDMHDPYGGAFKVTAGLSTAFPGRVISTPISEAGVVGTGIGLALAGYRPIVEIMFADFVTLAMDQIFNHAVKFPGMFHDAPVPMVIRTPPGGRRGYGPTHSQCPENLLCAVPGLTVLAVSRRHEPGVLLWNAAMRWPYPTVFLEHKLLYGAAVDSADYTVCDADPDDPGAALFPTLRRGSTSPDITIVAYGGMIETAELAAAELVEEELEVEIVVPSLLSPLPKRSLAALLMNRPRIMVAEEAPGACGFGAELATMLLSQGYRGGFTRVAAPPVPVPAARSLEAEVLPDQKTLVRAALELLVH